MTQGQQNTTKAPMDLIQQQEQQKIMELIEQRKQELSADLAARIPYETLKHILASYDSELTEREKIIRVKRAEIGFHRRQQGKAYESSENYKIDEQDCQNDELKLQVDEQAYQEVYTRFTGKRPSWMYKYKQEDDNQAIDEIIELYIAYSLESRVIKGIGNIFHDKNFIDVFERNIGKLSKEDLLKLFDTHPYDHEWTNDISFTKGMLLPDKSNSFFMELMCFGEDKQVAMALNRARELEISINSLINATTARLQLRYHGTGYGQRFLEPGEHYFFDDEFQKNQDRMNLIKSYIEQDNLKIEENSEKVFKRKAEDTRELIDIAEGSYNTYK